MLDNAAAAQLAASAGASRHASEGCWLPRRYKRAIWVVIDALRYDFAHWQDEEAATGARVFYHNRMPVLHEVLQRARQGGDALLYEFEADPPTVTMQVSLCNCAEANPGAQESHGDSSPSKRSAPLNLALEAIIASTPA